MAQISFRFRGGSWPPIDRAWSIAGQLVLPERKAERRKVSEVSPVRKFSYLCILVSPSSVVIAEDGYLGGRRN